NIIEYSEELHAKKIFLSDAAVAELKEMTGSTMEAVQLALDIFSTEDYSQIDRLEEIESRVDDLQKILIDNHVDRLMNSACNPTSGVIFSDIVTDLERCSDYAINIAYALKERDNQFYT
ncbi:MAG: Na/Pi cotransporter family protein, partial [Lachnospiraceae bacterium]|nr:Na/Pi cotransporter family protein [Lachnospiraceae bacterium]